MKNKIIAIVLVLLTFSTVSCSTLKKQPEEKTTANQTTQTPNNDSETKAKDDTIYNVIPNPADYDPNVSDGNVQIKIVDPYSKYEIYNKKRKVDLSFLGLDEDMYIVGALANTRLIKDAANFFVDIDFVFENVVVRSSKGALILFVINKKEEEYFSGYVIVLDYYNKKSYINNLDLHYSNASTFKIKTDDITGDGCEEIVLMKDPTPNITYSPFEPTTADVMQIDDGNLKSIYDKGNYDFSLALVDDGNIVLEHKKLNYKKTFSLIDFGKEIETETYEEPLLYDPCLMNIDFVSDVKTPGQPNIKITYTMLLNNTIELAEYNRYNPDTKMLEPYKVELITEYVW